MPNKAVQIRDLNPIDNWDKAATAFSDVHLNDLPWKTVLKPQISSMLAGSTKYSKILDAGCGSGSLIDILINSDAICPVQTTYKAFDWSSKMIEIATKRHELSTKRNGIKTSFNICDLQSKNQIKSLYKDEKFDLIFCLNVLVDHVDFESSIKNLSTLVTENGRIIVAIENPDWTSLKSPHITKNSRFQRNCFKEFKFTSHFLGSDLPIPGWHRSADSYRNTFASAGLRIIREYEPSPCLEELANINDKISLELTGINEVPVFRVYDLSLA